MKTNDKEIRYQNLDKDKLEFRDDSQTISGYAIMYDTESQPIGGEFVEVIEKRALDGVDTSNTYLLYQHNTEDVLASTKAGTLSLRNTDKGLYFTATLPDTQLGKDTYTLVKRGDLSGMSFGFTVKNDTWNVRSEPAVRKVNSIDKLYELSVVTFPAYSETVVSARSLDTLKECKCCKDEFDECQVNLDEAKEILDSVKL
jgi:HK97 family phage prohead protease